MIINILSFVLLATIVTCVPTSPPGQPSLRKRQSDANDGSPFSGDVSLLRTINGWRYAFGVGPLTWSQDMANAAANTGQLNEASSSMQHHNPSDAAEVIAPGSDTDMGQDLKGRSPFEISLISWLCENPGTTMKDACGVQRSIMNSYNVNTNNPTGHHDILVDNSYTKIGCAFTKNPNADSWFVNQGMWVCDLHW